MVVSNVPADEQRLAKASLAWHLTREDHGSRRLANPTKDVAKWSIEELRNIHEEYHRDASQA